MDATSLVIGVVAGAFGMGYLAYGKSQQLAMFMISGIILCIYPYFVDNVWINGGVGVVLVVLPFIFSF